jgi:hypothetical protein
MIAARPAAAWFETRGVAALLTMRVYDLILRACEWISDLILRSPPQAGVSKDEATAREGCRENHLRLVIGT